jgi:hypothetical protein
MNCEYGVKAVVCLMRAERIPALMVPVAAHAARTPRMLQRARGGPGRWHRQTLTAGWGGLRFDPPAHSVTQDDRPRDVTVTGPPAWAAAPSWPGVEPGLAP